MSEETKTTKAAPVAQKLAVETWAERKGFLPDFFPGDPPARRGNAFVPGKPRRPNPEYWKFRAAQAGNAWVTGTEVTEAEFDAAIAAAIGVVHH